MVVSEESNFRTSLNLIGLRCIPLIPFWVLNIVAAMVGISLRLFILTTAIGILPITFLYVWLGAQVREHLEGQTLLSGKMFADPKLWLPFAGLAILLLLPSIIKHVRNRRSDAAKETP
jgi:uncharacterized membrane protein YdjX (TVP38/TMEM64 family)